MHPIGTSSREHNAPKSNKLLELQSHESSWRAQPDATNAKGKNTPSGQILLSEIQPKQLMLWRDLGGRTKEKHQELQNLDLLGSPHLEEERIGGMVDLDLLS